MPRLVVVGGGVTGLVAARTITRCRPDAAVTLVEQNSTVGGKIKTSPWLGGHIEEGADSLLDRDGRMHALALELGLAAQVIEPAIFAGSVWDGRRFRPFPRNHLWGLPLSPWSALREGALGPLAAARAAMDLVLPGPLRGPDVSVGSLVRKRFGAPVLRGLVDPILAGTRAGDPERMSLAAALPQIDAAARSSRSVIAGLREAKASDHAAGFLSFRSGLNTLPQRLARELSAAGTVLLAPERVVGIGAGNGGLEVDLAGGECLRADGVVLAVPASSGAQLVREIAPRAAGAMASIRHATVAAVSLAFDAAALRELPGSGVLIPSRRAETISAATWTSKKWPHAVPARRSVVRAFIGRGDRDAATALDDDALASAAAHDLNRIAGTPPTPDAVHVARWENALPLYEVGHLERVSEIEGALEDLNVVVAGASYRGTGIPDCIAQAEAAARRVTARLREREE